ncbi:MAG: hypothetical protein LBU32_02725 [Clostridiales bacterium]|nr:hypothetical protein [Clostridiales bacterium]
MQKMRRNSRKMYSKQNAEDMFTMREFGKNMAYLLRCLEAGKSAGINLPEQKDKPFTNFTR